MNNIKTIKMHLAWFASAAVISATGFAYEAKQAAMTSADYIADLDYLPAELLSWL